MVTLPYRDFYSRVHSVLAHNPGAVPGYDMAIIINDARGREDIGGSRQQIIKDSKVAPA